MLLIVDKSEESSNPKIVKMLRNNFSQVIVTNLPHRTHGDTTVTAGDINIPLDDGSILAIERKTPSDFLNSIPNRHIFDQVEVMANNSKYSAIIVTGSFSYKNKTDEVVIVNKNKMQIVLKLIQNGSFDEAKELLVEIEREGKTNWKGISVRAAIHAIEYSGCPVIFCPENEFCNQISELYQLVNKSDKHQGVTKNRIITFPPIDSRVEFLAQLPGVGMKLADSLLSFAGMMDDNADELGYGSVVSALHYMSIMLTIDKSSRPAGWGVAKVQTCRLFFGLASDEYIAHPREIEYKQGKKLLPAIEINNTIYVKAKEL